MKNTRKRLLSPLLVLLLLSVAHAQIPKALEIPLESQKASVLQRVGFTDITVNYHSPAVKGRELWGKFVQYGQVWRAGANENTTIRFTHDVKVDGQPLAAGELFVHANGLLNQGKAGEALAIAKMNVKKYPQNWQSHYSLALVYEKNGGKKQALKNFETAKANATDENAKKQIDGRIRRLL